MIAIVQKHLLVFQIIIPLMAAPLCSLLRRKVAWLFATLISWVSFAFSVMILQRVLHLGPKVQSISYEIGNWNYKIGIVYKVDAVNAFVLLIVTGIAAAPTGRGATLPLAHLDKLQRELAFAQRQQDERARKAEHDRWKQISRQVRSRRVFEGRHGGKG